jgi:hypothetical protein
MRLPVAGPRLLHAMERGPAAAQIAASGHEIVFKGQELRAPLSMVSTGTRAAPYERPNPTAP